MLWSSKKRLRNYQEIGGNNKDRTTKCPVGSWTGSWNRKRTVVGKLLKPK